MDRTSAGPALVLAAVFLLSSLAALPQSTSAQPGVSSLGGRVCSIDAVVAYIREPDAGDAAGCGASLADAKLRLTRPGVGGTAALAVDASATTDGNGTYRFDLLADGNYSLHVERAGYEPVDLTVAVSGATFRDIGLRPETVTVAGTVRDPSGAPLEGVRVTACCTATGDSEATTDAEGAFELKTAAGERTFTVFRDGAVLLSERRFVDGSAPVELVVQPAPRPDAFLRGTVKDQHGAPVAGLAIEVYSHCCPSPHEPMPAKEGGSGVAHSPAYLRPHGGSNRTVTDAAGRYSIGVHGGPVSVNAYREGYSGYSNHLEVRAGEEKTLDIQLMKHPAKTARLEGRVVDAEGQGLRYASISVQSPAYGIHECTSEAGATPRGTATAEPAEPSIGMDRSSPKPMPPEEHRCAITIQPDGTFSGQVTPGYTIVQVHHDSYRACPPSEDGNYRPCAPEYYGWSRSLTLAADRTTTLEVELRQRPAPDAVVSGYLLDDATGKPIAGGQVMFGNQDGHGWGHATTDKDGSYRIRIRSGPLEVSAYAEGHLRWVGILEAARGETPLDIRLVAGEESHGGCCYALAGRGVAAPMPAAAGDGGMQTSESSADFDAQGSAPAFEDLRGGLGPYDAAARSRALDESRASPAAGLLLLVALMGCAAWLRRR